MGLTQRAERPIRETEIPPSNKSGQEAGSKDLDGDVIEAVWMDLEAAMKVAPTQPTTQA